MPNLFRAEVTRTEHRLPRLLAIFGSRVLNESVQWNEIVFVGWWMMVRVKYWTQRMITRSCDGILNKLSNSILALIFKDYTNHLESVKLKFLETSIPSSNGIFHFLNYYFLDWLNQSRFLNYRFFYFAIFGWWVDRYWGRGVGNFTQFGKFNLCSIRLRKSGWFNQVSPIAQNELTSLTNMNYI